MNANFGLAFARPEALVLLLLLLPLAVYLSRTSMALLRRGVRRFSLALRLVIIILLVLALSGVEVVRAADRLSVVFLLDRSDSISQAQQVQASQFVKSAITSLGSNDAAGVVMFGADALLDRPVVSDKTPPDLASAPATTYSNLAEAIRLGLAVAPADTERRLVLLSDGKENIGSADAAARLSAANGVPIDVVPLPSANGPEVWMSGLKAPSTVRENERTSLEISVNSNVEITATLSVQMDGVQINNQEIRLVKGANNFVQNIPAMPKGFHTYTAQVIPTAGADTRPENNTYSAYSLVLGKPRVLIVEKQPGEGDALKSALSPSTDADLVTPEKMPADVKGLAGYEAIILVNVPATDITRANMDSLQAAVHDLGKGLIVIGGDESYAAGGYFRTPLEQMLPLDLNLPSKLDIPTVGMVLVIDRSGSMETAHDMSGTSVTKLELAKEAAYRAVAQLSAKDYVGVITFDSAADWVVDMQPLGNPAQFKDKIGGISPGGGTNIYSGLAPAVDALAASKAKSKHIVLMTDGQSEGGDYPSLLKKMADNGITLSTIAIGTDADQSFLQGMASAGKGRFYYTEDGNALPEIFAHESHLAASSYIIEHPFAPEHTSPSPILDGLGGLPQLQGYVGTTPKNGGQVVLVSDAGDPILAQWQYGLGRVVAWTSDAKGQWAKDWVGWQDFSRFWGQAIRWSTGTETNNTLQSRVDVTAGTAHVTVDASQPDGSFLNDLSVEAAVVAPSLTTDTIKLHQSAAGRYEGEFSAQEQGAYLLRVQASGGSTGNSSQTMGVVVPYSPEYRGDDNSDSLLPRIASLSSGRVVSLNDPAAVLDHNLSAVENSTPAWPLLLLLSVLLLPLDVGVRRVAISRRDWQRGISALRQRWRGAPTPAPVGASSAELSSLFTAKQRMQDTLDRRRAIPASQRDVTPDVEKALTPRAQDLQHHRASEELTQGWNAQANGPAPFIGSTSPGKDAESGSDTSLATKLRRSREGRR